ncbi:hypothetical protein PYV50_03685 [Pseudomonas sp. H22_DOA]|nr:hypothetical protein PYV50_03685 [Pseudomonas sp. H22_DOA]
MLAKALGQAPLQPLTRRIREQARSHKVEVVSGNCGKSAMRLA